MEQLVIELNSRANQSSPERVRDLQSRIQLLQREKSAWQTGLDFLHDKQAIIRFYGALTLTIKINADWDADGLSDDSALRQHLFESLLNAYVQLTNLPDASFVLKKICATLSTLFFKASSDWELPVRSVLVSMANGFHSPETHTNDIEPFASGLTKISYYQLRGLLWLCSDLAVDIGRLDSSTPRAAKLAEYLSKSAEDVWQLIYVCLQTALNGHDNAKFFSSHEQEIEMVELVLQIVPLWTPFAPSNEPKDDDLDASMNYTLNKAFHLIIKIFELIQLTDSVLVVMTSLLEGFPRLVRNFQRASGNAVSSLVKSRRASDIFNTLLRGGCPPEGLHYVQFLNALIIQEYNKEGWWHSDLLAAVLLQLRTLMTCPGVAILEDEICQPVLETLNEIMEASLELTSASEDEEFKRLIFNLSDSVMSKAQLPIKEMDSSTSAWDADDRAKFQEFRQDATDFLISAYTLCGNNISDIAVAGIRKADLESNWMAFEAYIYSLSVLLNSLLPGDDSLDSHVFAVFESQMWNKTVQDMTGTPDRVRQGAIKFVSYNTDYLQRHPDAMVPCLNFLFSSLYLKGSATSASRAIHILSLTQSKLLVEALPHFITSLKDISASEPRDRHRIYSAVAAIVQAVSTEEGKVVPLSQILELIAASVKREKTIDGQEGALASALDTLQSLSAVGRGLRSRTDAVIDLDAPISQNADFWTSGGGQKLQQGVLTICRSALTVPGAQFNSDIVEAACDFIKSGYTEQHPSPFKFLPSISVEFLSSQITLTSPNIEVVMSCASSFLASSPGAELRYTLPRLTATLINAYEVIFAAFQTSQEVPDSSFSSSTFDFISRLLPKCGQTWLSTQESQQSLGIVLEVALIVLGDPDTLPRRSAASLIAAVLDLSGSGTSLSPPASTSLAMILQAYGPRILALLLRLLAGDCARSELEALTEPLKRFVSKQGSQMKFLLREAMKDEAGVLTSKALAATTLEQRMRFVAQVEGLRGARKTNEVVREFWIDCRGSGFAYVV